jgi:parallel beta-helix repeat protein
MLLQGKRAGIHGGGGHLAVWAVLVLGACDEATDPPPDNPGPGGDLIVRPGESIQAAVNSAQPGNRILLQPGLYEQSVTINKPGIRLVGDPSSPAADIILQNPGGAENGITVTDEGDGVEVTGLTVRHFGENGVLLVGVDVFLLSHIIAESNGEYGLFPVRSSNGVITDCVANGHEDTGIYVGLSENIRVENSTASRNVNGIEVENSSHIQVTGNETFDNTAGILVVLLPGLSVKTASDIVLMNNAVHDNNRPNLAQDGFEQSVPSGSGILIVGTDQTTVQNNGVTGNAFVGIGVANTGLLAELTGVPIDDIDPFPDGVRILSNDVSGNGGAQPIPTLPPGVDLLWDGTGEASCWSGNDFQTSLNLDRLGGVPSPALPSCL